MYTPTQRLIILSYCLTKANQKFFEKTYQKMNEKLADYIKHAAENRYKDEFELERFENGIF